MTTTKDLPASVAVVNPTPTDLTESDPTRSFAEIIKPLLPELDESGRIKSGGAGHFAKAVAKAFEENPIVSSNQVPAIVFDVAMTCFTGDPREARSKAIALRSATRIELSISVIDVTSGR